jgi:hypothetical protein
MVLSFFLRENTQDIAFHWTGRKRYRYNFPREGHTHKHSRPHRKVRRCQPYRCNDNERSHLVQHPTKNGEAARQSIKAASQPLPSTTKENHNSRAARANVPSTLMCLEESAGGWQDPTRTNEAIILEAPSPAYIAPWTPTPYATTHSQQRIKPHRKDRWGHHLQLLPASGLHVQPKQRLQERNGAETPSLPCPAN